MEAPPAQAYAMKAISPAKGNGLVATRKLLPEEIILRERPAASQQDVANREQVLACAHCHRFIGTVAQQIEHLTGVAVPVDATSSQVLAGVVRCHQGCGEMYCSAECRELAFAAHHRLLCVGPLTDENHPLVRFKRHAVAMNDIFLLGAQVVARIVCEWLQSHNAPAAYQPFAIAVRKVWWEVGCPKDAPTEEQTRYMNDRHHVLHESYTLLSQALFLVAPESTRPLLAQLFTLQWFASIVGMFELNNHSVEIDSPLTAIAKQFPVLQRVTNAQFEHQRHHHNSEAPVTETPCPPFEGTGFFPILSTVNHSCSPNAFLRYRHDNLAELVAIEEIPEGAEICISYIDDDLPYEERARELADYDFVCDCEDCLQEIK